MTFRPTAERCCFLIRRAVQPPSIGYGVSCPVPCWRSMAALDEHGRRRQLVSASESKCRFVPGRPRRDRVGSLQHCLRYRPSCTSPSRPLCRRTGCIVPEKRVPHASAHGLVRASRNPGIRLPRSFSRRVVSALRRGTGPLPNPPRCLDASRGGDKLDPDSGLLVTGLPLVTAALPVFHELQRLADYGRGLGSICSVHRLGRRW